jgi:hypothetical protein
MMPNDYDKYTYSLMRHVKEGTPLHVFNLRTTLETMPLNQRSNFIHWLSQQHIEIQDAWVSLGNSGMSSPWVEKMLRKK